MELGMKCEVLENKLNHIIEEMGDPRGHKKELKMEEEKVEVEKVEK